MFNIESEFYQKVLDKYGVHYALIPINHGNGEFENASIPELRVTIDFCYYRSGYSHELLDYLEDYIIEMPELKKRKNGLKRFKKKRKELKRKIENLGEGDKLTLALQKEVESIKWVIKLEKYVTKYLREQRRFLRHWCNQKRLLGYLDYETQIRGFVKKSDLEYVAKDPTTLKKTIKSIDGGVIEDYLEVASLFVQGFIKEDLGVFYYKDKSFEQKSELIDYLKAHVLIHKNVSIRQIVGATLNNKGIKNLRENRVMLRKTIDYCKNKQLIVCDEYKSILSSIERKH